MQLRRGTSQKDPGFYMRAPPSYPAETRLRILPGPQQDWFVPAQRDLHDLYTVLADSDRTGVRLKGMPLVRERTEEIPSAGVVTGVIQVPGDGQPIVLLSNHGTTGGYPVIAVVISADLSRLAQLAPGSRVRMVRVDRELALAELRAQEQRLADDIVAADASLLAARALIDLAGRHRSLKQAVVGDGQRRIRIRSN
jgi:allophanate hydrolase subunit 2